MKLSQYIPVLDWGRTYDRKAFSNDMIAALIVTIMLIPQSLAYAIVLYAVFGTSRALAVGPVAVVSLLTASAIGQVAEQGTAVAFLSGGFLVLLGVLRLGFLANFLSHPVIAGFITASGILIATSQLKHILGISAHGHTLPEMVGSILSHLDQINWITVVIGVLATGFLFWVRKGLKPLLKSLGASPLMADILTKAGPVLAQPRSGCSALMPMASTSWGRFLKACRL